jgi:hypothetical protein
MAFAASVHDTRKNPPRELGGLGGGASGSQPMAPQDDEDYIARRWKPS